MPKYAYSGHAAAYSCVLTEESLDAFLSPRTFLSCPFILLLILFSDSFSNHSSLSLSFLHFCNNFCNNLFFFHHSHFLSNLVILLPYIYVPWLIILVIKFTMILFSIHSSFHFFPTCLISVISHQSFVSLSISTQLDHTHGEPLHESVNRVSSSVN